MFEREDELVKLLKNNISQICKWNVQNHRTVVLQEVNLGFGIADLVISRISGGSHNNFTLSNREIAVYSAVNWLKEASLNQLMSNTGFSKRDLSKSLNILIQYQLVKLLSDTFQIDNQYQVISTENIAIEAKLKDWKRALGQAFRYKWFASQSYVVMDRKHIHNALNNIHQFIEMNVGLAEIDQLGVLNIHFSPKYQEPYNEKMFMILNEKIRADLF